MSESESQNMDMSAKPVDTSTQRIDLEVNGEKYWFDFKEYQAHREWLKKKEDEYWEYHFSGQRTIDMFGVEGAKRVLEDQHRREMRMCFNHKSRGKK